VALKKRLENRFKDYCTKIGASNYSLEICVKTNESDIELFREKKAEEDQQIVMKTIQEQQKRMQNKHQNEEVPFSIGQKIMDEIIPMEQIQEEERRVSVQGYVFDVEVRELRSGRSLLIMKVTDYSDSLEIKMFSRNDEDEVVFAQAKAGIWIKAR